MAARLEKRMDRVLAEINVTEAQKSEIQGIRARIMDDAENVRRKAMLNHQAILQRFYPNRRINELRNGQDGGKFEQFIFINRKRIDVSFFTNGKRQNGGGVG